jgi:hypothetical protein
MPDSVSTGLLLGAVICVIIIPGWILYRLMDAISFWLLISAIAILAPVGLALPRYIARANVLFEPRLCITSSVVLTIWVSGIILLCKAQVDRKPMGWLTQTMIANTMFSTCASLVYFLVYTWWLCEHTTSRRWIRWIVSKTSLAPQAKVQYCNDITEWVHTDFAAAFPDDEGRCSICLDFLAELPEEVSQAHSYRRKHLAGKGLLRFPCKHAFHGCCAEKWLAREITCPMCRQSIGSLRKCTRILVRSENAAKANRAALAYSDIASTLFEPIMRILAKGKKVLSVRAAARRQQAPKGKAENQEKDKDSLSSASKSLEAGKDAYVATEEAEDEDIGDLRPEFAGYMEPPELNFVCMRELSAESLDGSSSPLAALWPPSRPPSSPVRGVSKETREASKEFTCSITRPCHTPYIPRPGGYCIDNRVIPDVSPDGEIAI